MAEDTYRMIAGAAEGLYKEKGSKFLAFAFPVLSVEEVKEHLEALRKEYFDARHHCYAYILGQHKETYRANDDGEPSGTGGRPIHRQLLSADLTNTLVVVVRYFGGILLGASGLANAYKTAARDALDHATIEEHTIDDTFCLHFEYPLMNDVMRILKEQGLKPTKQDFQMDCCIEVNVRKSQSQRLSDALSKLYGLEITVKN